MSNAKIAYQIEQAYHALEQLTGADVEVCNIRLHQGLGQPVLGCIATAPADRRMDWVAGCRIDWITPEELPAAEGNGPAAPENAAAGPLAGRVGIETRVDECRSCGCTELSACRHDDGLPCFWVRPGLCSVCAEDLGIDVEEQRMVGAEADVGHAIAGTARGELPR